MAASMTPLLPELEPLPGLWFRVECVYKRWVGIPRLPLSLRRRQGVALACRHCRWEGDAMPPSYTVFRMAHVAARRFRYQDQNAQRAAARVRARQARAQQDTRPVGGTPLAEQAVASAATISNLLGVQRVAFPEARRPVVPKPVAPEVAKLAAQIWLVRQYEVHRWQWRKRAALRLQVEQAARIRVQALVEQAEQQRARLQADADEWWRLLVAGDPHVVGAQLERAFYGSGVPVMVAGLGADSARLRISLPDPSVLPAKRAHVTPTGRQSARAWTKTELDAAYRDVLAAHLLASIRRTWAAAPSLRELVVRGQRISDGAAGFLFEVTVNRDETGWNTDNKGIELLARGPRSLRTTASATRPVLWPF